MIRCEKCGQPDAARWWRLPARIALWLAVLAAGMWLVSEVVAMVAIVVITARAGR